MVMLLYNKWVDNCVHYTVNRYHIMATDYLNLGPTPLAEDCAQVGEEDYHIRTILECRKYIRQLEHMFGEPMQANCYYRIKSFPHDFGTYHEVVLYFNDEDDKAVEFAYNVEANLPENWLPEFNPNPQVS